MNLSEVLLAVSKMNESQIDAVIDVINRKRRAEQAQAANGFHVGQKVSFKDRQGRRVKGTVLKVNPKNIKLRGETGVLWNVTATLLTAA